LPSNRRSPIDPSVDEVAADEAERLELGAFFGEDFELVCTIPETAVARARRGGPLSADPDQGR